MIKRYLLYCPVFVLFLLLNSGGLSIPQEMPVSAQIGDRLFQEGAFEDALDFYARAEKFLAEHLGGRYED